MFKLSSFIVIAAIACVVSAAPVEDESKATVDSYVNEGVKPDGSYTYTFKTSNNIAQEESGVGGASVAGKASWIAQDGTPIEFSYIANEDGFQPKGAFVPTIPPAIQKSLEYNLAHPADAAATTIPI